MVDTRPIGVFDSGIGGITIMSELVRQLPGERFVYLADSAEAPYGSKTLSWVERRADQMIGLLVDLGVKLVVVACNTASVAALPLLRGHYDLPFVGVVPAVRPAAESSTTKTIGVLATPATARSASLANLVTMYGHGVSVHIQPCPDLAALIERGVVDGPRMETLLRAYLTPILAAGADKVVLGCTHYWFLRPVLARICGPNVELIDSSVAVARHTGRVVAEHGLRGDGRGGPIEYLTTGDPVQFRALIERLAGRLPSLPSGGAFCLLEVPLGAPILAPVTSL